MTVAGVDGDGDGVDDEDEDAGAVDVVNDDNDVPLFTSHTLTVLSAPPDTRA